MITKAKIYSIYTDLQIVVPDSEQTCQLKSLVSQDRHHDTKCSHLDLAVHVQPQHLKPIQFRLHLPAGHSCIFGKLQLHK